MRFKVQHKVDMVSNLTVRCHQHKPLCTCMCVSVYVCMCVCVSVCEPGDNQERGGRRRGREQEKEHGEKIEAHL